MVSRNVRNGSWPCKNTFPGEVGEKSGAVRSQAAIAAISGSVPTMFMTRVRLLARTESAISAATFGQEVRRSHAGFHRTERMFDCLPPLPHGLGVFVEASLRLFHHVLMLPARNPPFLPGCAASFERTVTARIGPITP
jgi:hypothetical protein